MSAADRSTNWREPAPGLKRPAAGGAGCMRPQTFRTRAFAKKPAAPVNPFPPQRGLWQDYRFSTATMKYSELPKCGLCKVVLSRARFPQELDCCEHAFCAACIYKHYFTEKKKQCPCCEEYIRFEENPAYCSECQCAPCRCEEFEREDERERALEMMGDDEECCRYCGPYYCFCDDERACPCGFPDCPGGCGALPCGCTDVCKGRCDPDEYCGGF